MYHSFSVCRSTLLFSVCRTILRLSVCRTILLLSVCRAILHLSVFVELSYFCLFVELSYLYLCQTLILFSVCRSLLLLSVYFLLFFLFADLSYVCLFVEQYFLLRPLNKHSHKSTRMGPQFKITFLTKIFIRWMHFFFFSSPSSVFLVVINQISGKTNIPKDVGHISKHISLVIFKL